MRICSIITSFTSGGAEVLVGNLAERFTVAGHAALVLALSDAATVGNSRQTEQEMMARMRVCGVRTRSLALQNRNDWLGGAVALRRAVTAFRPDVIHAHTVRALPIIALARLRTPVVLTHHNSRLPFPAWGFRVTDFVVDAYVAISDACAAQIRRNARRPIRKILNAASTRFRAATPRDAPAANPAILAVGTVSRQKDYETLVRAARVLATQLAPRGRRAHVSIAGAGPMLGELRAFVDREGAGDVVALLGARSDVDALMRKADIFVNTSLWEGLPIAMIEATMSGLPIVATDVAGNREMVTSGVNGTLVPPSDPAAIAEALAAMIEDSVAYAALSRESLRSADRFSIESCTQEHLSLYATLQAGGRGRSPPTDGAAASGAERSIRRPAAVPPGEGTRA
uniref:glycosyltransferase n=1 Tax=uncultured Sphingomonas sp. TaxID=158754 RepID=UPI0035CA336B